MSFEQRLRVRLRKAKARPPQSSSQGQRASGSVAPAARTFDDRESSITDTRYVESRLV
jgi:hypothetical protein